MTYVYIFSWVFLVSICIVGPYWQHKLIIKEQEFNINHLIKLDNTYQIKINTIKKEEDFIVRDVRFYENDREIDPEIVQYKELHFSYYFRGKNAYYIFNKITKKLIAHEKLDSFNKNELKAFKKYF